MSAEEEQRRPWQPGDGIRCSLATRAPREMPCGPPVVTVTQPVQYGSGRYWSPMKRVLCANHADADHTPSAVMTKAKKAATERLITEHWDTYQEYVELAVKAIQAAAQNGGDPS